MVFVSISWPSLGSDIKKYRAATGAGVAGIEWIIKPVIMLKVGQSQSILKFQVY